MRKEMVRMSFDCVENVVEREIKKKTNSTQIAPNKQTKKKKERNFQIRILTDGPKGINKDNINKEKKKNYIDGVGSK